MKQDGTITIEQIKRSIDKARGYRVPKFMVNGKLTYIYFPKLKRWASVLDNIEAS